MHALVHGQVGSAFGYNVLAVTMLPVLGYMWLAWLIRSARGQPRTRVTHPAWIGSFTVLVCLSASPAHAPA